MDEDDKNKFTLMALSPVNRHGQKILDSFACVSPLLADDEKNGGQNDAKSEPKFSIESSKPTSVSIENQNTLSTPKTPSSEQIKDEVTQTSFQNQRDLNEEQRDQGKKIFK
jgi:hypothetical protein